MSKNLEIERNFIAFQKSNTLLQSKHLGRSVLMRNLTFIDIFDNTGLALSFAKKQFPDNLWSIHRVEILPIPTR